MILFNKKNFVCSASLAATSHKKNEIANQNSFSIIKKHKYTLLVLSEGKEGKPFADLGAKKACEAVESEIKKFVKNKKAPLSVQELFFNIVAAWKELILPQTANDCSATCLFVLVTKHKILAARLGDGMIYLLGNKETESILLSESRDVTSSNAGQSLSDSSAALEFKYVYYDRSFFRGILLSTGEISAEMKNEEDENELSFANKIFEELLTLPASSRDTFIKDKLESMPEPHNSDDKTLIVAGL
jgi:hypothetical protein